MYVLSYAQHSKPRLVYFLPHFSMAAVYIVERLKLSFFQKATKICEIFLMVLTKIGLNHLSLDGKDDCANFCGLLRKAEL